MYVSPNCASKKQLKTLLADGKHVDVFSPGLGSVPLNGTVALEGPHSPKPHSWYATGTIKDGRLIKVV